MAESKISRELDKRLATLSPEGKVHAILLFATTGEQGRPGARRTPGQRRNAIHRVRADAEQALPEIDRVLARFGGRRLADHVNALGSLPVEATPAGIRALAASDRVKAILEDQKISLLR